MCVWQCSSAEVAVDMFNVYVDKSNTCSVNLNSNIIELLRLWCTVEFKDGCLTVRNFNLINNIN